jgi:hypothetical protein
LLLHVLHIVLDMRWTWHILVVICICCLFRSQSNYRRITIKNIFINITWEETLFCVEESPFTTKNSSVAIKNNKYLLLISDLDSLCGTISKLLQPTTQHGCYWWPYDTMLKVIKAFFSETDELMDPKHEWWLKGHTKNLF